MSIPRTLNQDFFKVWSGDMAYVLGFFAADGSMIQHRNGGRYIEFNITDRIIVDQIKEVTRASQVVTVRSPDVRAQVHWKQLYRLQIGSKAWFQDLSNLGFTQHKSNTLTLPAIPPEFFGDFVRGYFDGDGCVYFSQIFSKQRNKHIWMFISLFTCGSRLFLESLWEKLMVQADMRGGHISEKSTGGYELVFSRHNSVALYHLMYHTSEIGSLFLPRKRAKFEQAIETLGLKANMRS